MDESSSHLAQPMFEALRSKKTRKKKSVRRVWSRGLPSLATSTVRMVVATLQLAATNNVGHIEDDDNDDDDDDDDPEEKEETISIEQQLQAHIPDIVLHHFNDLIDQRGNLSIPSVYTYNRATLLFLDVSGFTSLTEQYSNDAHLGIDQLTHTLNSYFDKLVSEILINHGDVYKFAGDAILALWTNQWYGSEQALRCALDLQEKFGAYETDVGVVLRLKIALAYGPVRALFVGNEEFKHYILTGDCVKEVNMCEQVCEPGDIMITKAVHEQVQSVFPQCEFVPIKGEAHSAVEHIAVKYLSGTKDRRTLSHQETTISPSNSLLSDSIDESLSSKIDGLMKSFLLRCVSQRIERQQSLDYLSELRRVTISFINLNLADEQSETDDHAENVQQVFVRIYELTKMMGGVLTKALLFDKGWSFLCVFGLPGYKQGDDTANALKCAQMIDSTIRKQCSFIEKCSIGVATGLTYCGVVGHVARCEYTVIGRKVNMAARLMCNYPDMISCDQETYYNSRLNSRFFQILPDRILKGMHNVGIIWQYGDFQQTPANPLVEPSNDGALENRQETYPLLGRRVELMMIAAQIILLDEPVESTNRRRDLAAFIFEGEDKIGRSRLLQFIADSFDNSTEEHEPSSENSWYDHVYLPHDSTIPGNTSTSSNDPDRAASNIRVIKSSCRLEQRFNEFSLLRSLLRQLLQFLSNEKTPQEREQCLLRLFDPSKLHDFNLKGNLFLFNDLLNVNFRRSHVETERINDSNVFRTYETIMDDLLLHILNQLLEPSHNASESSVHSPSRTSSSSVSPVARVSKILFIIDDIHFADESSLKHLLTFGSHSQCLLILSMKPPSNNNNDRPASNILRSISTDSRVYLRRLPGLEPRYLATLGCQILGVCRLPEKLVKVLNESCNGIPGFCEQILLDLLRKDKIYIADVNDAHEQGESLKEGDVDKLLLYSSFKTSLFKTLFSRRKQPISEEQLSRERALSHICLLRDPTANDFDADCQQNFQNYLMCRIDRLSEGESLLVKIAAVIGNTFSRTFLWQLVDPQSRKLINMNSSILDMMQRTVIECAYQHLQQNKKRVIRCFCLQNCARFPWQCRLMAFAHVSIREGIYNTLTDSLKRSLTRNAIDYLEKQCTVLCLTCGPRTDSPFFVQKHDGLARVIKTRHQHTFVDIVKMAALKEIDTTIKQSIRLRSMSSPSKPRSNTSSNLPPEPITAPAGSLNGIEQKSSVKTPEKRRNSIDSSGFVGKHTSRSQSPFVTVADDDLDPKTSRSLTHHESSNPNLTLISVYPGVANQSIIDRTPVQVNVQRSLSLTSAKSNHIFTLFKIPKHRLIEASSSSSSTQSTKPYDDFLSNNRSSGPHRLVQSAHKGKEEKSHRVRSFFRYIFCQMVPFNSNPNGPLSIEGSSVGLLSDTKLNTSEVDGPSQLEETSLKRSSHWPKVRQALLVSSNRVSRAYPDANHYLNQPMFAPDVYRRFSTDLHQLTERNHLTRTFENLYEESLRFHTFQSYVQYKHLIHHAHESRQDEISTSDENPTISHEFTTYNDLRICQCADYVFTVQMKLIEYHTNLYDIYDKLVDDKRDYLRRKQFDRIMYYRTEICHLLQRSHCFQRLLVEIDNGRKFLQRFQRDTIDQENSFYQYLCVLTEYTYHLFEAIVLQRTSSIPAASALCQQSLLELNAIHQQRYSDQQGTKNDMNNHSSAKDRRVQYEHSKDYQHEISYSSQASHSDQISVFIEKYRLEYLICQYHLLQYRLSGHQSTESVHRLIALQYHFYPIAFSLPCTVVLVEYFFSQTDYLQCSTLIQRLVHVWWADLSLREKLELGKLKSIQLIVELKQGALESSILSGYFAKRLLTGYHENVFLIETCIHLTLALIGEMRISNIELILQHLEYLSEQTMNYYAKLWYYILIIDVAMELGYELIPMTIDFLENISKYRQKLLSGLNPRSLLAVYSDCTLAQIYVRLGRLTMSKRHFQQALYQIKFNPMYLSSVDFRFQRALLKLIETQLIYWYYTVEREECLTKDSFLLTAIESHVNDALVPWNRTRFAIYQAYYDRLINDYRRERQFSIDNDFNWQTNLQQAESTAIKLDLEWIQRLRLAWLHPVADQLSLLTSPSVFTQRPRTSSTVLKQPSRSFLRPSIPQMKMSSKLAHLSADSSPSMTTENYAYQKFIDWRVCLTKTSTPQFQLYVLPVRV